MYNNNIVHKIINILRCVQWNNLKYFWFVGEHLNRFEQNLLRSGSLTWSERMIWKVV